MVLLFGVGLITGVLNGSVLWANKMFSIYQSRLLSNYTLGPLYFILTTTTLVGLSAFIIRKGGLPATIGAGMPEVKALIVKDFKPNEYPRLISLKIGALRVTSLILASCSGLSVGLQGPLVHVSVCTSYVLATLFPGGNHFLENPSTMRQIFAASAAVGLATVFNAPVGGLLFSVEVTSTYYLISNYWRSFMAATTGAVMYSVFLINRDQNSRIFEVDYIKSPYHEWELVIFMLVGVVTGVLALLFLYMHQYYYTLARTYLKTYPVSTAMVVGAFSALMIYALHLYSINGVSVGTITHDAFQSGNISELNALDVSRVGGLIVSLIMRIILTIVGTTLQISCGLFMPMLSIGAILGRIVGQVVYNRTHDSTIYVAGYAMVGAASFVSGSTHTISAAVIVIEMTGQINMLLPCLLGAVIACGITKTRSLSLYDQGMVNKSLESFELLLLTSDGFSDVLDKDVISVTATCQIADLFLMLENTTQLIFPIIDTVEHNKLIGSINRRNVYLYLKSLFSKHKLLHYVRGTLLVDTDLDDQKITTIRPASSPRNRNRIMSGISEANKAIVSMSMSIHSESVSLWRSVVEMVNSYKNGGSSAGDSNNGNTEMTGNPLPNATTINNINTTTSTTTTPTYTFADTHTSVQLTAAEVVQVESLLLQNIHLSKEPLLQPNNYPFTVPEHSTMDTLYVLFEMVKVPCVFVLSDKGTLKGMISKQNLLNNLRSKVQ